MSGWTKQRLEQMIAEGIEESLSLDYKRAASLAKNEGKRDEVTKDVSSFANSSGGVLIYGVAEFTDGPRKHLPASLDPINRTEISKEWLDQVIQSIQPRIEGVVIHPVTISETDNTVCYIVEVPQSHTAHMARDHRYHKRQNFTTVQMEDYEVRDVMNRRTHPKIKASIFINRTASRTKPEGVILVKLENVGRVLAKHIMVELEIPMNLGGFISVEDPVLLGRDEDGEFYHVRMTQGLSKIPIFPDSTVTLQRTIHTQDLMEYTDKRLLNSRRYVRVSVFADEAPPLRTVLEIGSVIAGWTPIESKRGDD